MSRQDRLGSPVRVGSCAQALDGAPNLSLAASPTLSDLERLAVSIDFDRTPFRPVVSPEAAAGVLRGHLGTAFLMRSAQVLKAALAATPSPVVVIVTSLTRSMS